MKVRGMHSIQCLHTNNFCIDLHVQFNFLIGLDCFVNAPNFAKFGTFFTSLCHIMLYVAIPGRI